MPDSEFDWQIGSESWEDTPPPNDGGQVDLAVQETAPANQDAGRSRSWFRRAVLIVVLVLGVAGVIAAIVAARRYDEITAPAKKEIGMIYDTLQLAVAESDKVLFASLLSGSDSGWRTAQQDLFNMDALWDRSPFGFRLEMSNPRIVDIVLSPERTEAEVVTEQAYTVEVSGGVTQTAWLRHVSVYRHNGREWLMDVPDSEFWGEAAIIKGQFLDLTYPERDDPIGRRLARDLDAVLGDLCAEAEGLDCPASFHLRLRLERLLSYLADMLKPWRGFRYYHATSKEIWLPTPTLIGTPIDEAGYRALFRSYARQIVQAANAELILAQNWQSQLIAEAETDKQLIRLGLLDWPGADAIRDSGPAPIPFPDQDIAIYCIEGPVEGGTLFRYSLPADHWSPELSNRLLYGMTPLPSSGGIILQEQYQLAGRISSRLTLWQDGQEHTLFDDPQGFAQVAWWDLFDPSARRLVVFLTDNDSGRVAHGLLHLDRCTADGCDFTQLPGYPTWSPDGSRVVIMDQFGDDSDRYYRADGNGESLIEIPVDRSSIRSPFWLDNETYGYVRSGKPAITTGSETPRIRSEIVIASIADDRPRLLLSSDDLLAALPANDRPEQLDIGFFVRVNPGDPSLLFILAYGFNPESGTPVARGYIFSYDLESQQIISSISTGSDFSWIPRFSPDGRWLAQSAYDATGSKLSLILHHTGRNESKTLEYDNVSTAPFGSPLYQWSADGQWLLLLNDGILHLIAPDHDYERTVIPESPGCAFAAWVNHK